MLEICCSIHIYVKEVVTVLQSACKFFWLSIVFRLYSTLHDCMIDCESEGDVRLINGLYPWEGRVEMFYEGRWGTVCNNGWNAPEAIVVCHQLGYNTSSEHTQYVDP